MNTNDTAIVPTQTTKQPWKAPSVRALDTEYTDSKNTPQSNEPSASKGPS
ncbi:Uncharacterised protein [BD1-7 clade bacterium]|uniref:Uncharacterized protein n=1 Tax=BD1-7 clade bacterium TaxID=2029982 RepID=A0A5S9MX01_9GAMM|nr:Uncharacterised protein [BD1-7 clade bacterium]CAA0082906.1 Uncharacterised protein [BD1-7 clade bacterium]